MDNEKIFAAAVEQWGPDAQLDMLIEEMGELIVAIQHFRRSRAHENEVLEGSSRRDDHAGTVAVYFC